MMIGKLTWPDSSKEDIVLDYKKKEVEYSKFSFIYCTTFIYTVLRTRENVVCFGVIEAPPTSY